MGKDILPLQFQFDKSSFQNFEKSHPDLTQALTNWNINDAVRDKTSAVAAQSPFNKVIVALYIAKHAPEGEKIKDFAVNAMRDFYATLYDEKDLAVPVHVRENIQDVIGDFLIDNKAAFDEFCGQIKAWDMTNTSWRHARSDADDSPDMG
ncbi:MAG: hypothetical protein ACRBDL_09590 [Alphaproteobacteria bacterium]